MNRGSGILMHISSLPGKYGVGTLGKSAYQFADFLKQSGQRYWQILPLGHTGYGDSPYQCFSAYAGNPYFIDLEVLQEEGLLAKEVLEGLGKEEDKEDIDFAKLFHTRYKVLRIAYENGKSLLKEELARFRTDNEEWIEDYSLYMAVKESLGNRSWLQWDAPIQLRKPEALCDYREKLKEEINFWVFVQYEFYKQWKNLKEYVNLLGIQIIGDLPIYIAADSSDAWACPELFQLDENKIPIVVAGCPPDAFTEDGQLWGNPIYDWEYLERTGYDWWIRRMKKSLTLYDILRIDHFRGFEAYWAVPYGDPTAKDGKWIKGPGIKLFDALKEALGEMNIIAEDLGFLTQEVIDFREEAGYPGMKVLQFGFGQTEENGYMPHNCTSHSVMYTGTHDNSTIKGWFKETPEEDAVLATRYFKLDEEEGYHWGFIRGAWASVSNLAVTQMQDLLGLDDKARMNKPGALGGNWTWRMKEDALTDELAQHIYDMTKLYGRSLS